MWRRRAWSRDLVDRPFVEFEQFLMRALVASAQLGPPSRSADRLCDCRRSTNCSTSCSPNQRLDVNSGGFVV
jgi:hypothetical protein